MSSHRKLLARKASPEAVSLLTERYGLHKLVEMPLKNEAVFYSRSIVSIIKDGIEKSTEPTNAT